jgi:hypothetical protein
MEVLTLRCVYERKWIVVPSLYSMSRIVLAIGFHGGVIVMEPLSLIEEVGYGS